MKTRFFQFSLLLLLIGITTGTKATTVTIYYAYDSTTYSCPLPASSGLSAYGYTSGYNYLTDSVTCHVFWGDGTDTIFKTNIAMSSNIYPNCPHNYYLPGTYIQKIIATGPDGSADTAFCPPLTVTNGCGIIDGYTYEDINGNCIFDAGDNPLYGIPVEIKNGSGYVVASAYSDFFGHYITSYYLATGTYTAQPHLTSSYMYNATVCPVSGSYSFTPSGSMSFNFALDCVPANPEFYVNHGISGAGAPGLTGQVSFLAGNYSCQPALATVTLVLDPNVTYTGMISGPPPTTVVGNTLTWDATIDNAYTGALYPTIEITTLPTATLYANAWFDVSITTTGDPNTYNNDDYWPVIIGGPWDPNNKEVKPAGIGTAGNVAPGTEFTYTINFQNTGTSPAINIYLLDTINNNLDMSTLKIMGSSHAMQPIISGTNLMRFDFPNINLIDSTTNEPLSHGWVMYSIKTKTGLANGTQIKNTSHIYFDYNPAVVTNTTLNTIDISMGAKEITEKQHQNIIYPNPATNNFTVQFEEAVSGTLFMLDASGKTLKQINLNGNTSVIVSTLELESGFYALSMPGVVLKQNRIQVIK